MYDTITFKCDMCGEQKESELISFLYYNITGRPGMEISLKYCVDNYNCRAEAEEKAKTGKL